MLGALFYLFTNIGERLIHFCIAEMMIKEMMTGGINKRILEKNRIKEASRIAATRSVALVFAPAFFRIIDRESPPVTTMDWNTLNNEFTMPKCQHFIRLVF